MKKVNKKYRCVMEMDENGVIKHDGDKLDHDTALIFCAGGKACITKYDDKRFVAYVFSSNMFKKWTTDLKSKVKLDGYLLDGEGVFTFLEKDLDDVCIVLKAKKQAKTVIGITNFKNNRNYYLRILRNIDPFYHAKLKDSPKWQ